ncbi:DUF2782 domain-containing protein [Ferrovum myxofaciens]|jgi:hypothetical protein|uniref:DUF2782 domain-containing protein n=1 Tax=Ferrovum myxofaciens TaxID=416213 RepID=UPI00068ECE42|nr:DUF2782 domain-containing protein [Ferrovum myxofaciens]NDU89902.1 DUF2782 domain-containing protein [Ferrovum sp.]QKE40970.1 MAG: DUF2782 domain-containing protein [Ferrovum myxofaciens]
MTSFFRLLFLIGLVALGVQSSFAEEPLPPLGSDTPLPPTLDDSSVDAPEAPPKESSSGPVQATPSAPPTQKSPSPPQSGSADANDTNAQVTIVERDSATFEEYRIRGRLYKIKVTPKVGPPYYLIDEDGSGIWHQRDVIEDYVQPPQWVIFEF